MRPLELSPSKRNLSDFSLWRPEQLIRGKWDSPWGIGSPGWHIQDTAITLEIFGSQYDIHGGAYELTYPHHEAEIAQGESISGRTPMVKYWVHTHLVTMAGEKMSKSVGNVYTVRDALRSYRADAIRLCLLSTHYRDDMDLSGLGAARRRLRWLRLGMSRLALVAGKSRTRPATGTMQAFYAALNDDFNTPLAIEVLARALEGAAHEKNAVRASRVLGALRTGFNILGVATVG
jgi:cysteinyl-tRNA synthetase